MLRPHNAHLNAELVSQNLRREGVGRIAMAGPGRQRLRRAAARAKAEKGGPQAAAPRRMAERGARQRG